LRFETNPTWGARGPEFNLGSPTKQLDILSSLALRLDLVLTFGGYDEVVFEDV